MWEKNKWNLILKYGFEVKYLWYGLYSRIIMVEERIYEIENLYEEIIKNLKIEWWKI